MPLGDNLLKNYEMKIKDIGNNMQGLEPGQIEKVLAAGGSLSSSLGYSDPRETFGMTPEQFDQMLVNRSLLMNDNLKQIGGAINLRDQLYGISETRKVMQQMARDEYQQGNENVRQEQSINATKDLQKERLDFERRQNEINNAMTERHFNINTGLAKQRMALDREIKKAELEVQSAGIKAANSREAAGNATQIKLAKMRLDELKKQKEITDVYEKEEHTRQTYEKLGSQKEQAIQRMGSKDASAKAAGRMEFFRTTMQQEAMQRQPGFIYDTGGYIEEASKWPKLMMDKDHNWYGIKPNPKGKYGIKMQDGSILKVDKSESPIITHPAPELIKR